LTRRELLALVERLEKLRSGNRFPLPDPRWPSIPWPPV
jgi:hypothetical protein